jgi:probable rRNA maturation factor
MKNIMKKRVEIELYQRQKKIRVDEEFLKEKIGILEKIVETSLKKIFVYLVDNKTIKKLNKIFLNKNTSTDVLSFKYPDGSGEIIISVEECKKNAKNYSNTLNEEILYVLIHGILHLNGYEDYSEKDREKMFKKQDEIFCKIVKNEKKEKLYIT